MRKLKAKDKIALKVGKIVNRFKMAKHFHLSIGEEAFSYERTEATIAREASLDGIYVIRTSLTKDTLQPEGVVHAYKQISSVERAFRSYMSIDLKMRPIHHRLE